MSGSEPFQDPKLQISEALRELRSARHALHESVVRSVQERNRIQEEVADHERRIAELKASEARAGAQGMNDLAGQIRDERGRREGELAASRQRLVRAEAAAEISKTSLPEDEARLLQQANELHARLARLAGEQVEASAPDAAGSAANELWERAGAKVRDLAGEASARDEVAVVRANSRLSGLSARGEAGKTPAPKAGGPIDADQMLTELEARIALRKSEASGPDPGSSVPGGGDPEASEVSDQASAAVYLPTPRSEQERPLFVNPAGAKGARESMENDGRVRVAAVGTGNIFRGAHLPCYPEIAQVRLVAICDPDKRAQDLAYRRYQSLVEAKIKQARERDDHTGIERLESDLETVQMCEDISEVIELVKPDLVDICTQPMLHAPLAIQALNAGINVMCEKPISRSWLESRRVIEAVNGSGKLYQHNENWLWDPDYYTAKKLIDAGAIGEPILMFLATAHGGPEGAPKFWNSDFGGGGALLDNGIHAIGASWFMSGLDKRPTVVKAAEPFGMSIRMPNRIIDGRYQKITVDDDAHILIRFENAETHSWSTAHVEGSWSHRDSPDTVIIGTTGKINFVAEESRRYAVLFDAYEHEVRRIQVSGPTWQPWPSSFYGEILNMAECVRSGIPSISDARFGAECSAIVGAAYLSERDGRRGVNVEEFKTFANEIAARYPNDTGGADDALVDALLSAVRKPRG